MHAIVPAADALALLCVAAAFGAASVLYGIWKTRLLRLYMLFVGSIAAFAMAMTLEMAFARLERFGIGTGSEELVGAVSMVIQAVGGVVHVAVLPRFVYGINNREPSNLLERAFFGLAAVMALLALILIARPGLVWIGFILTGLLFSAVLFCVLRMIPWIGKPSGGSELDTSAALRVFLWVSIVFMPLFGADIVVSSVRVPEWISTLDGISLSLYLILLSTGSIAFAKAKLGTPPLYQDQELTDYCRSHFGLTDREAEVVEYIMEGYSVPDLASVLGISPKTAEHHLYSAYDKLSVNNRVQLYNTLMARR